MTKLSLNLKDKFTTTLHLKIECSYNNKITRTIELQNDWSQAFSNHFWIKKFSTQGINVLFLREEMA